MLFIDIGLGQEVTYQTAGSMESKDNLSRWRVLVLGAFTLSLLKHAQHCAVRQYGECDSTFRHKHNFEHSSVECFREDNFHKISITSLVTLHSIIEWIS